MKKKYHLVSEELLDISRKVKEKDKARYIFYTELKEYIRTVENKGNIINGMINNEGDSDEKIQSKLEEYFSDLDAFFLKATPSEELVEGNIYQEKNPFTWEK